MALIPLADAIRAALVPPGSAFTGSGGGLESIFAAANIQPLLARMQAEAAAAAVRGTPSAPAHVRDLWERATGGRTTDQALRSGHLFRDPPGFVVRQELPSIGAKIITSGAEEYLFNTRTGALSRSTRPGADASPPGAPFGSDFAVGDIARTTAGVMPGDLDLFIAALQRLGTPSSGLAGAGAIDLTGAAAGRVRGPEPQTSLGQVWSIDPTNPFFASAQVLRSFNDGTLQLRGPDGQSYLYNPTTRLLAQDVGASGGGVPLSQAVKSIAPGGGSAAGGIVPLSDARRLLIDELTTRFASAPATATPGTSSAATLASVRGGSTSTVGAADTARLVAESVDDNTLQQLLQAGHSLSGIARFITTPTPTPPLETTESAQGPGVGESVVPSNLDTWRDVNSAIGALGGAAQIAASLSGEDSDANKALGVTRGVGSIAQAAAASPSVLKAVPQLGVLNAGVTIAGQNVPYLGVGLTALDIGRISASDMSDDQKAFYSAAKVGELIASIYGGPISGLAASIFTQGIGQSLWGPGGMLIGDYGSTRRNEASKLPDDMRVMVDAIIHATTEDELTRALRWDGTSFGAVQDPATGRVLLRGVHLDVGPHEKFINELVTRQRELIRTSVPGKPNDPLAPARAENALRKQAYEQIAQFSQLPEFHDPEALRRSALTDPAGAARSITATIREQAGATLRNPQGSDLRSVLRLEGAARSLGLDPISTRDALQQIATASTVTGGGVDDTSSEGRSIVPQMARIADVNFSGVMAGNPVQISYSAPQPVVNLGKETRQEIQDEGGSIVNIPINPVYVPAVDPRAQQYLADERQRIEDDNLMRQNMP